MKLFYSPASPYARKARIVAHEKGIALELASAMPMENTPELVAANPMAKIPALVADDGRSYCESLLICEYFEHLSPAPSIFRPGAEGRIETLRLDAFAVGVMEAAVRLTIEGRRPETARWPAWQQRQKDTIRRGLDVMEKEIISFTGAFTLEQISLAATVDYIAFRHPSILWQEGRPAMAAWREKLESRASLRDTAPA